MEAPPRSKEKTGLPLYSKKMKGWRVDSFLQCIPPGRLGYLSLVDTLIQAQANFYQFSLQARVQSINPFKFLGSVIPALVECLVGESVSSATLYAPGSGQSCWMGACIRG